MPGAGLFLQASHPFRSECPDGIAHTLIAAPQTLPYLPGFELFIDADEQNLTPTNRKG
jgi:hypothetical protein